MFLVFLFAATGTSFSQSTTSFANSFDDVKIAYSDAGNGDTVLVLVHGWCCDRRYWSNQIEAFSSAYRVVAIDLAGHGESEQGRMMWSMQAFGEDIAAVADTLHLKNIVLIGHSSGGYAVLAAAQLLGDRLLALIGVDTFRFIEKGYFDRTYTLKSIEAGAKSLRSDFAVRIDQLVRTRFFRPDSPQELVDWVAKDMASAPLSVAIPSGTYAFSIYRYDYFKKDLTSIGARVPIFGINSAENSKIDATVIQEHAPRFSISYIKNVGHFIMMEKPAEFNAELTRILHGIGNK